jgi:Zinc-finger associated domain (zf-AD)
MRIFSNFVSGIPESKGVFWQNVKIKIFLLNLKFLNFCTMEPRCRICLEPNSLLDIFSSTDITPTVQEIEETTGIHITMTSRFPKFLCLNCVCEIANAYQLRVKARCSDNRLREIYKTKTEGIETMPVVKVERKRERSSSNESCRSYLDAVSTN